MFCCEEYEPLPLDEAEEADERLEDAPEPLEEDEARPPDDEARGPDAPCLAEVNVRATRLTRR